MKKIIYGLTAIIISGFVALAPLAMQTPAFAEEDGNCVETNFFGRQCGSEGISTTLKFVVRVLTVLIGVLAVTGITVVGIQYLTAGANEEKTRKAKRRLFEIVIGIVVFVLLYAILSWLLPGFSPSEIWS